MVHRRYYHILSFSAMLAGPVTGSAVAGGSFVSGTLYVIQSLGTTTQAQWETAGLPAGVPAAVGATFVAAGAGAGTGTVKAATLSGVYTVELAGDPQKGVGPSTAGSVLYFVCWDAAGSPVDPTSGSTLYFEVKYRNSTVKGKGE